MMFFFHRCFTKLIIFCRLINIASRLGPCFKPLRDQILLIYKIETDFAFLFLFCFSKTFRTRCATDKTSLRVLMVVYVTLCYSSWTANVVDAQFTNLRIFRAGDIFSKDYWRPLEVLKSYKDSSTSRKGSIDDSSPIKRISMMSFFHKKKPVENVVKNSNQDSTLNIPVAIESSSSSVTPPVVKESQIRRVKLPAGSITYSRNVNHSPAIQVNVNPHLQTTEPPTTTTETPSTTTTQCTIKQVIKTNHTKSVIGSAKKKLIDMPNSPIYYVKLPSSAFVSVSRTRQNEDFFVDEKQSPIFVATTYRPGAATQTTESVTVLPTESSDDVSTTTRKPPRTNSRIVKLKGPFVFNGKPGGIYSAPAPYRPPNYLELLHSIYPKLKRAQFIRR